MGLDRSYETRTNNALVTNKTRCHLCNLLVIRPITFEGQTFCCNSCVEVYKLLKDESFENKKSDKATIKVNREEEFYVSGIWCISCAKLLELHLSKLEGIEKAEINFIDRKIKVTFDSNSLSSKTIKNYAKSLGYKLDKTPFKEKEKLEEKLLISSIFVMHIMVTSFGTYLREWLGWGNAEWLISFFNAINALASIPIILLLFPPLLKSTVASIIVRKMGYSLYLSTGISAALALSFINFFKGEKVFFDTAAMLLFLVTLGKYLELRVLSTASAKLHISQLLPDKVLVETPVGVIKIETSKVFPGSVIIVQEGETIPVDGRVIEGIGELDSSHLTGEHLPIPISVGDNVKAGSILKVGEIKVLATTDIKNTLLTHILQALENSYWKKDGNVNQVDKVIPYLLLLIGGVSLSTFLYWYSVDIGAALRNSLSVLVISCPCAWGIAAPLARWKTFVTAKKNGIIIRNLDITKKVKKLKTAFVDKTGTLTQKSMKIAAIEITDKKTNITELLKKLASLAILSSHPIDKAIVKHALEQGIEPKEKVVNFKRFIGAGIAGEINGKSLAVGNEKLLQILSIDRNATTLKGDVFIIYDGRLIGCIEIDETLNPETVEFIKYLQDNKITVKVLTGAKRSNKELKKLNIEIFHSLSPFEKAELIANEKQISCMIGDGVNDFLALEKADIGIFLGDGGDKAPNSSDVIILDKALWKVKLFFKLSQKMNFKVIQNYFWSFTYNILALPTAIIGYLTPELAAVAMIGSSLYVTFNSLSINMDEERT